MLKSYQTIIIIIAFLSAKKYTHAHHVMLSKRYGKKLKIYDEIFSYYFEFGLRNNDTYNTKIT